jgi:Bacterial membrane protein YfhO
VIFLRLGSLLGLALVLTQALAWGLARGLGLRLPWKVQAAGLCLPLVVLLPLVGGGRILAPTDAPILANLPDAPRVPEPDWAHGVFNDAILQLLPWEAEVRRGFAEGHLPLWSDLLDGGSSPWVNPQAAVLSPVAMAGRLLPLEQFLLGTVAAKILLAFEGCWLLARLLGAGRSAAAFGAAGFALGGPVFAWAVFPLSSVVAWCPWLALGAVRVVRRPSARRVAAAALACAALLLSGHPELALAGSLVATGLGTIAWRRQRAGRPGRRRRPPRARLAAAALAAALGAGLAACQLLPFLAVAPRSLRAEAGRWRVAGLAPAGAPVPALPVTPAGPAATPAAAPASSWFAGGRERLLLAMLSPWAFGRPFHERFTGPANWPIAAGGYLGLVALAGIAAAAAGRRRRLAAWLAGLALVLFLLTAGFLPFRRLLAALPLGDALAVDRFLPAAALPLALLAALGLDALLRRRRRRPGRNVLLVAAEAVPEGRFATNRREKWRRALPGAAAVAPLAAAGGAATASLLVRHDPPLLALWVLLLLAVALARFGERALGLGLLAAVSLVDLGVWDRDVLPRGHRALFYPRTPLVAAVAAGTGASDLAGAGGSESGPWRAVAGGFALYPSLLPMYGVAELRIDNPMALAEQLRPLAAVFDFRPEGRRYKSAFRHLDHPLLDFLNVRVVVLADAAAAAPRPLELLRGEPPLRVYRNPAALPRWFLPIAAEPRGRGQALRGLAEMRDPRRVLLFASEAGGWRPPERPWDAAAVRLLRARRGAVSLALPAAGEKLLATSLPFPAGWTAAAAGRPLRRLTVNTAYLGVEVPAGVARVDLSFAPPGFGPGMTLSVLSALAVAGLAWRPGARRAELGGPRRSAATGPRRRRRHRRHPGAGG